MFSVFQQARKCIMPRAVFYCINNGTFSDNTNFERSRMSILVRSNVLEKNNLCRNIPNNNTIIARISSKASAPSFKESILPQVESIFKDVKMKDMADAPTPTFWYNMASLAPIGLPSLSYILTGFHPSLFTLQITFSALLLAFHGGIKLGHELEQKEALTWEPWAAVPIGIGWLSLILPTVLSPLMLSAGFLISAFIDLTLGCFPAWYKAIRLAFVIPAVLSLLIAFLWKLFNI